MSAAFLIAGAGGMLGTALQAVLRERGITYAAPAEGEFDITDGTAVSSVVASFAAGLADGTRGVLVNAAAYTNVEGAESERELAYRVNEDGPRLLAAAAREAGLDFVHVSTDFVFDGTKPGPYVESDEPNPLSVYGASKLAGELAVQAEYPEALVVRTAWVFGPGGANFPVKILDAAQRGAQLRVVTDEQGSPTYTFDLARGILGLVEVQASGLFHLAGRGACTRHELAVEVLRLASVDAEVEPVTSAAFTGGARRPANSVLDCSKAASLGVTMPEWTDALARFIASAQPSSAPGRVELPVREPVSCEVYGHFDLCCGLRVSTLNMVDRLRERGWPLRLHSIARNEISVAPESSAGGSLVNIFHINPGEFRLFLAWPHEDPRFERRMNVCVPYWELAALPESWVPVIREMDLVLAPTAFVADAIRASAPDVDVVLYPQGVTVPDGVRADRERFGLPAEAFVFGMSFGAEAVLERKNPWATIRAFQDAFPDDPDVRLVVRATPGQTAKAVQVWAELREFAGGDERVIVLDGELDYAEVLSLYASLDVYVSLHRAEGLGLGLMESMALGTPVIATGWSGNMDFMDEENSLLVGYDLIPIEVAASNPYSVRSIGRVGQWAEAKHEEAVARMREVRETPGLRDALGARARTSMQARFEMIGRATFADDISDRLGRLELPGDAHRERAAALRAIERSSRLRYPIYLARKTAGSLLRALHLR